MSLQNARLITNGETLSESPQHQDPLSHSPQLFAIRAFEASTLDFAVRIAAPSTVDMDRRLPNLHFTVNLLRLHFQTSPPRNRYNDTIRYDSEAIDAPLRRHGRNRFPSRCSVFPRKKHGGFDRCPRRFRNATNTSHRSFRRNENEKTACH